MGFKHEGPRYRVIKMVEAVKLHPKSLIPLSEPPVQLPFTAILEGLTLDREMYRFYYLGQPYQCQKKVMKSAIEVLEEGLGPAPAAVSSPRAAAPEAAPSVAYAAPAAVEADFAWESITTNQGALLRAKVPGGWLIRTASGHGICFYPDPKHGWDGSTAG